MDPSFDNEGWKSEHVALASLTLALVLFISGFNWPLLLHVSAYAPAAARVLHGSWIVLTALQGCCIFVAFLLASDEVRSKGLALTSLAFSCMCLDLGACLGGLAYMFAAPLVVCTCALQLVVAIQATKRDLGTPESAGAWSLLAWLSLVAAPILGAIGMWSSVGRLF